MEVLQVRPLTADLQKVAIEQLNEAPERIVEDIAALRLWIQQQPHLKARTDDQFLLTFLRGCKFSMEKAKGKIDKFYTLKTKFPEMFACHNVEMDKMIELLRMGALFYLPTPLNDNGPRIGVARIGVYSPEKYKLEDFFKLGLLMQEIVMREDDYAVVNGLVHIMDMSNLTAAHIFQMTPAMMKKSGAWNEEAIPLRPKANHFVHTPTIFEPIFNMVKTILSEKLVRRLFVHGNKMELLHQQIPKKYLPKEYGGENGTIQEICKEWELKLLAYKDYFVQDAEYGTVEQLRIGQPIDFESIFGTEGSFRKLNVD